MAKPRAKKQERSKPMPLALLGFFFRLLARVLRPAKTGRKTRPGRPARPSGGRGATRPGARPGARKPASEPRARRGEHPITALQRAGATGHWTQGSAVVFRNLPDDNEGSRHQRMLVKLSDGHVIKISHNIDLAKRVPAREGDRLDFAGDFESNELGGALHWTHLDPKSWHPNGWIDHQGRRYE